MSAEKQDNIAWLWFLLLGISLIVTGYLTARTDHFQLIALLLAGFVAVWRLYRSGIRVAYLIAGGILLRLGLLFMWPNLSEDIYRYLWDGQLLVHGTDPFAHVPSYYASGETWPEGTSEALYSRLNSKDYFSIYPPVAQYLFVFVGWLAGTSVFAQIVAFRLLTILAETISCILIYKQTGDSMRRNVLLYALNPVVILEITGNLHLEGILLSLILLLVVSARKSTAELAISHSLAIATKVVPLIFMPLLFFRFRGIKGLLYVIITFLALGMLVYPLLTPALFEGMGESLGLYFKTFEFNASFYFILREIGFLSKGYNQIATIGPALGVLSFFGILGYSWVVRNDPADKLPVHFGMVLTIFLALSTTVHPWYVLPVTGLMCLGNYKFAFVWSFTVMWSYFGYSDEGYSLPAAAIFGEYLVVFVLLFYEIWKAKKSIP